MSDDLFDPADHTIEEVQAFVEENPDQRKQVLSDEKRGKHRSTLIDWLAGAAAKSSGG